MNKKTVHLTHEEFQQIQDLAINGFYYMEEDPKTHLEKRHHFFPNQRLAAIMRVECSTGYRISDILQLRLDRIYKEGDHYRIMAIEKKTRKKRDLAIASKVYQFLRVYAGENGIRDDELLFPVKERVVQKNIAIIAKHLGLENVSTHSWRKTYSEEVLEHTNDPMTVMHALNHTSLSSTQRYLAARNLEKTLTKVSSVFMDD